MPQLPTKARTDPADPPKLARSGGFLIDVYRFGMLHMKPHRDRNLGEGANGNTSEGRFD
jgi:hypothetical protein